MNSSVKYWDRSAERYARRPIADPGAYQRKLQITQRYLRPCMNVMEFGCGTGSTALVHAPLVNSYLATDASPRMIDIARKRMADGPAKGLRFEVATLEDLDHRHEEFDAILGLNILHLLPDPASTIERILALLKRGGVFVSNTACLKDTRGYLRPVAALAHYLHLTPYVHFLSRKELERDLRSAGFRIQFRWVPESTKDVYFLIATKEK
ncbi:class I SAM-dependent methyltransferase [Marinobacter sp. M216]|uniref:Class I SAM-dependent methyltransferase n=1 Tax=Marinobacter albus TaxID=3030833 RepID=A0ABT7HA71_9GAMM|nr:class I SAM-dependent methyltransferase [Marinobacter sp. M216]MDK9556932.1 class I SAM-dependent methyltransferase [Marinobacter sp. M216]